MHKMPLMLKTQESPLNESGKIEHSNYHFHKVFVPLSQSFRTALDIHKMTVMLNSNFSR